MERRVRTGCISCRRRHVKCDETIPICNRCRVANVVCEYRPPRRAPRRLGDSGDQETVTGSISSLPSELSWRHSNWRQEQLPVYHHFVTTTAVRLFRKDHARFWRDQVAQISYGVDIVYEALLAVAGLHRASLLSCQFGNHHEASRSRVLALGAYGNTLRLLSSNIGHDASPPEILTVLIVLILLTYFECFLENPRGALQHLWASIQLFRRSKHHFSRENIAAMVPLFDAMLRLDFLAQKLVPYACSSFSQFSDLAMFEVPFWNNIPPQFGNSQPDRVAAEGYVLIQLVSGHNKLSRVVWGCWCPENERPSRDELLGYYSELMLWKNNSPATFAYCEGLEELAVVNQMPLESRSIPPPACELLSSEMALNMLMFNAYLGCAVAMISTTDDDPTARELEAFNLSYENLCIASGLIESFKGRSGTSYKPCDAISMGISMYLYHGARRCFSQAWQQWTLDALRSVGREGLSNGYTGGNTLSIMYQLESDMCDHGLRQLCEYSPLGAIRDRLIPLLLPRGVDGQLLAFYLRYGSAEADGDERMVQVVARASWKEDSDGNMSFLKLDIYDPAIAGSTQTMNQPQAFELFYSWRQEVERGWHGYLSKEVQEGFLQRESLLTT